MIALRRLIRSMFRACGYDVLRYTRNNFVSLRRAHFLQSNCINVVLDVGADEGAFALGIRRSGYTGGIVSFEPRPQAFEVLKRQSERDHGWRCVNTAIGEFDGETEINISGHKTSSSLLPISDCHIKAMPASSYVAKEKVRMSRLDSLVAEHISHNDWIYLKADVQGYEKQVLAGAEKTLKQTICIEVELSLTQMYEGSPLLCEMVEYLAHLGFKPVSIENVFSNPQTGYILQVDGIFVRCS